MEGLLQYLQEFNIVSVLLRMAAAMAAGGVIGYGRSHKRREVGLRTFMLISIGASLTVLLAMYEFQMLNTGWADVVAEVGSKLDATRYASQVLAGIGFLGAGTILADSHLQVHGLTSAAGLFAAAAMGMAAGAGFFEVVLIAMVMIIFVMEYMYPLEVRFKRRRRNLNLFVEFDSVENLSRITEVITDRNAQIYEIDVERVKKKNDQYPSAVIALRLSKEKVSHSEMLSSIAELSCVHSIQELIS